VNSVRPGRDLGSSVGMQNSKEFPRGDVVLIQTLDRTSNVPSWVTRVTLTAAAHFRSSTISRHSQGHSACLKSATSGTPHSPDGTGRNSHSINQNRPLQRIAGT
jgi:hypothetical protein